MLGERPCHLAGGAVFVQPSVAHPENRLTGQVQKSWAQFGLDTVLRAADLN